MSKKNKKKNKRPLVGNDADTIILEEKPIDLQKKEVPAPEKTDVINDKPKIEDTPLSPVDAEYVETMKAMATVSGANQIKTKIQFIENKIRAFIPATDEELKIIMSRINDIKPDTIDVLDDAFVENIFKIEDNDVLINFPEIGDFNKATFVKDLIRFLKASDEQVAVMVDYLKSLNDKFNNDFSDEIKGRIRDREKLDDYVTAYYRSKLDDPTITEDEKHKISLTLQYSDYAKTLVPFINDLTSRVESHGSESVIHGFKNSMTDTVIAAQKVTERMGIAFPFQLFDSIEKKLLGGIYSNFNNLFLYIIARHIKYRGDGLTAYDKVFLSQLFSNLVTISRTENTLPCPNLTDTMKTSIKQVLDIIIKTK